MIRTYQLKKFNLNKGNVLKGMNKNDKNFNGFGEVYFSFIKKNQIKGWKKHTKMKMNLIVPIGKVEFRFFNEKKKKYQNIIIGQNNYKRIFVPNNIWFAFKGHNITNLIMNVSNIVHAKNEVSRKKLKDLKFYD